MSKIEKTVKPASDTALTEKQTELVNLLKAGGGTAAQLADMQGCSGPTLYSRVKALIVAGYKVQTEKVRGGAKGPKASHFSLPK